MRASSYVVLAARRRNCGSLLSPHGECFELIAKDLGVMKSRFAACPRGLLAAAFILCRAEYALNILVQVEGRKSMIEIEQEHGLIPLTPRGRPKSRQPARIVNLAVCIKRHEPA